MEQGPQRIIELEIKIAFLERTLEELADVVLDQGRELERLERRLRELDSRLASKPEGGEGAEVDPLQERPPHY
jgi:SlyX protein